jgi:hypothetical protein
MKATLINKYNKLASTGNIVRMYVYKVIAGTADEVADFQSTQGVNYREDEDGSPLYFTTNFEGNVVDLVKSKAKDRETGDLIDAWRPLSSEDFELKRSIITASSRVATPATAVTVKKVAAPIVVDDVEY